MTADCDNICNNSPVVLSVLVDINTLSTLYITPGSGCEGPASTLGCVISIIYVIIGVPLMFIYLLRIGGLLANLVTCFCCNPDKR